MKKFSCLAFLFFTTTAYAAVQELYTDSADSAEKVATYNSNFNYLNGNKLDSKPGTVVPRKAGTYDLGTSTTEWRALYVDSITANGYIQAKKSGAGAPSAGDCNADAQRGRLYIDTTNNRLYVCNGGTRLWDYLALTD